MVVSAVNEPPALLPNTPFDRIYLYPNGRAPSGGMRAIATTRGYARQLRRRRPKLRQSPEQQTPSLGCGARRRATFEVAVQRKWPTIIRFCRVTKAGHDDPPVPALGVPYSSSRIDVLRSAPLRHAPLAVALPKKSVFNLSVNAMQPLLRPVGFLPISIDFCF